jgi:hypothetical protein
MPRRLGWLPAFAALLLAQAVNALVLLEDDRYVHVAYRIDPFDPAFVDETQTPASFFGSFPEQPSTISIAAGGLGFDATAHGESSAYFDYFGPYATFNSRQSSFELAFRIDGAGQIGLYGSALGGTNAVGDPWASLTDSNGVTLYYYFSNPFEYQTPISFNAPVQAGEYVLQVYTGANLDGASGSFDVAVAVRDTAVPVVIPFVCDNELDDDADGLTDFPADPGCESPGGATEDHVPACSNGADDDGDTLADSPADPGCTGALDESELGTSRCDNGIDDDADGAMDYPADSDCASPTQDAELTRSLPTRWKITAGGNGHAYEFVYEGDLTWEAARIAAALRVPPPGYKSGHLASIASVAENEFLFGLNYFTGEAWIGFTDEVVEGEWRWIDDTPGVWQDPSTFPTPVQTAPYVNWTSGCCGDHAVFPTEFLPYNFEDRWSSDEGTKPAYYVEWEPAGLVCDDGVDEDGDGLVDFPADPGCTSATDPDEEDASLPCDDGLDNDLVPDGLIDFSGGDPDCVSPIDPSEAEPECRDGWDNDGDGLYDYPDDPGCPLGNATPENPPCDDGIDNDGDGAIDLADSWCSTHWPYWESPPCGIGAELALVLLPVGWLDARRRRTG